MERRRNQITSLGLRLIAGLLMVAWPGCGQSYSTPGARARQFASFVLEGGRDSSLAIPMSDAALQKLAKKNPNPERGGTRAILSDSSESDDGMQYIFRLTEPGSAVFPHEPTELEVTVDPESLVIVDYRFR